MPRWTAHAQARSGLAEATVSTRITETASVIGQTTTDEFFEGFDDLDLFLSGKNLRELLGNLAAASQI